MKHNIHTLFNIKVNTYICRELYRKCGNNRNVRFIEEESRHLSYEKKKAYYPWKDIISGLNISESKVERIITKGGASCYTKEEAKKIGETYNINYKYFVPDNSLLLPLVAIEMSEWKKFFNVKYGLAYVNRTITIEEYEELNSKISKALDKVISDYRNELMSTTNPLYRICWYHENARTFEDKDIQARVRNRVRDVYNTETFEWSQCSNNDIDEFICNLSETLEFLKAYKICRKKFEI